MRSVAMTARRTILLMAAIAVLLLGATIRTAQAQSPGEYVGNVLCDNDDGHMLFNEPISSPTVVQMEGTLPLANASFSIGLWLQRRTLSTGSAMQTLMAVGTPAMEAISNAYLTVGFDIDDTLLFAFNANNLKTVRTFTELNVWQHFVLTYSTSMAWPPLNRCAYKDGLQIVCESATSNFVGTGEMILGASAGPSGVGYSKHFRGAIDQVHVFSRALSPQEALCLATSGTVGTSDLLLRWFFSEQTGSTIADSSPVATRSGNTAEGPLVWERLPALPVCLTQTAAYGSYCTMRSTAYYMLPLKANTMVHATWEMSPSGSPGAEGVATFDGSQYIEGQLAADAGYPPTYTAGGPLMNFAAGNDWTMAFWVYVHTSTGVLSSNPQVLYSASASLGNGAYNWYFYISSGGVPSIYWWHSYPATCNLASTQTVMAGGWNFVGVTWTAGYIANFFVNGVQSADSCRASPYDYTIQSYLREWTLGIYSGDLVSYPLIGKIASFTLWNSVRTGAQMDALSASPPLSLVPFPVRLANQPRFQTPGSVSPPIMLVPGLVTSLRRYHSVVVDAGTPSNAAPIVPAIPTSPSSFAVTYSVVVPQRDYTITLDTVGSSRLLFQNGPQSFSTAPVSLANTLAAATFTLNLTGGGDPRNYQWAMGAQLDPAGDGFAVFNGFGYIDLFDQRDVGTEGTASTMPKKFAGIYEGWSVDTWLRWESEVAATFFECSSASGSSIHRIHLSYSLTPTPGFVVSWNNFKGNLAVASTGWPLSSAIKLPLNQWNHVALTVDAWGTVRLYKNGALAWSTSVGFYNVPPRVTRNYCAVGRNYAGTGQWTGRIASWRMHDRLLLADEVSLLASAPPLSIGGRVYANGLPFSVVPGSSGNMEITTDWVTGRPLRVDVIVAPTGYATPSFVTLTGSTSSVLVAVTFSSLPVNGTQSAWSVSFSLSGDLASNYLAPDDQTVRPVTYADILSSAAFRLDTSFQSLHAQWDGGLAWFDGSTTASSPYLSLTMAGDTGSEVMPTSWGVDPASYTPAGFGFSGWFYVWSKPNSSSSFFQCTSSSASLADMIHIWSPAGLPGLLYQWNQGVTPVSIQQASPPTSYGVVPLQQFFHLGMSLDVLGNFELTINGESVPLIKKDQTAAPLFRSRLYCTINRDLVGALETTPIYPHWSGAVTGFNFFNHSLSLPELVVLSQHPPPQCRANFSFVGVPLLGAVGQAWAGTYGALRANVSLIAGASVTLHMAVERGDGFTVPTSLTFGVPPAVYGQQSFDLTLAALTLGATNWTLSFWLSGPSAYLYTVPDPIVILPATESDILSSLAFDINTAQASLHAGWIAGARPGTGVHTLNGVDQYIDLTVISDTRRLTAPTVMPVIGGWRKPWSIEIWAQWAQVANNIGLLYCGSNSAGANRLELLSYTAAGTPPLQGLTVQLVQGPANTVIWSQVNIAGSYLAVGQWFSAQVSFNHFSQIQVAMFGNVIATIVPPAVVGFLVQMDRPVCRVGMSGAGLAWSGQIASFRLWQRPLIPAEMAVLANTPPQNIAGSFTFFGLPFASLQSTTYPAVSASITLITNAGVSMDMSVSPSGYTNPTRLTWASGVRAPQSFILNLGALLPGQTFWTISFALVANPAIDGVYTAPAPIIVQQATIATLLASADFFINTTRPSANAGFLVVPGVDDAILTFAGVGSTDYLNLGLNADVHAPPLSPNWNPENGFSVLLWIYLRAYSASMSFFECSPALGSNNDVISLGTTTTATTAVLRFYWWRGSSSGTPPMDYAGVAGSTLQLNQWMHIGLSVDPAGIANLFIAGTVITLTPLLPVNGVLLPLPVQRDYCSMGRNALQTGNLGRFNGFVSSLHFWNRALVSQEVGTLAGAAPPSVTGNFSFVGIPYAADALNTNTLPGLLCFTNLITSFPVTLNIFVSGGGYTSPSSLTFSASAIGIQTLQLTLPALVSPATTWTLSFTVTSFSSSYTPPADMIVRSASIETTVQSAHLFVNTSRPSIHASWSRNLAYFNGLQTVSGNWLDLTQPADVNSGALQVMPSQFGGLYTSGWSFSMWVYIWSTSSSAPLFQCTKAQGDNSDLIQVYFTATTGQLQYQILKGGTISLGGAFSTIINLQQWVSIVVSQDGYGQLWLWVNGVDAAVTQPVPVSLPVISPYTNRVFCAINQQHTSNVRFTGALANFFFFTRILAAAEAVALSTAVPANLQGTSLLNITTVGLPASASYGQTVSGVLAVPSLVTNAPLILSISVWPAGTIVPSTITWSGVNFAATPFAITLLALPAGCNCNSWEVQFSLSGPAAVYFQTPPAVRVLNDSLSSLLGTRSFSINTDLPSVHSQWIAGAEAGTGLAVGTGAHYLDLSHDSTDTRNGIMPLHWGIAPATMSPQGFAFGGWVMRTSTAAAFDLIHCWEGSGAGMKDRFYFRSTNVSFPLWWQRAQTTAESHPNSCGVPAPLGMWFSWTLSFDAFGAWTFYMNGNQQGAAVAGSYPYYVPRTNCYHGRDHLDNDQLHAQVTATSFWNRTMSRNEALFFASNPPPAIKGTLTIVGVNTFQSALGAAITPVVMSSSLVCGAPMSVGVSISPAGSMTPQWIPWVAGGTLTAQTFQITLSPLSVGQTNWTITWVLQGAGARFFTVPPPITIHATSFVSIMSSALFNLNTFGPPLHANWLQTNAADGNGVVVFDVPGTQFIDLQDPNDNNNSPLLPQNLKVSTGFTISAWFNLDAWQSGLTLFSCAASPSSVSDLIRLYLYPVADVFQFVLYGSATGVASSTTWYSAPFQFKQWAHISLAVDPFNVLRMYVHGNAVSGAGHQLSWPMRDSVRTACYVGMQYDGSVKTAVGMRIAGLTFWERGLIASEVKLLANNPPSNIVPGFVFTNVPMTGEAGVASTPITVFPTLMTSQPVSLSIAVTFPSYATAPMLTWSPTSSATMAATTFTLQLLATAQGNWTVSFNVSANGVSNWALAPPAPIVVKYRSLSVLQDEVAWSIDMTRAPAGALSVTPGIDPAFNTFNFDSTSHLVLTNSADVGAQPFPLQAFDGAQGWTISTWISVPKTAGVAATQPVNFLACSANLGSQVDLILLGLIPISVTAGVPYGFYFQWYNSAGTVQTGGTPAYMSWAQGEEFLSWSVWQHVSLTYEPTANKWDLWANGQLVYSHVPANRLQSGVTRNYCAFNWFAGTTTGTSGPMNKASLAGMQYWNRWLSADEIKILSNSPPPAIATTGQQLTMPPASALPGDLLPLTWVLPLLTPFAFSLSIAVHGAPGTVTPSTLSWPISTATALGQWAPQSFALSFTSFGAPSNYPWVLSFTASGVGAQAVSPPANITIVRSNYAFTASSAVFSLVTSAASAHAGWTAGSNAGQVWMEIDGLSHYADLFNPQDTLSNTMPAVFPTTRSGYSFGFWFKWSALAAGSSGTQLLYFAPAPGSTSGEFYFGLQQTAGFNAAGLRIGYNSPSGTGHCALNLVGSSAIASYNIWMFLSLSHDGNGGMLLYLNGNSTTGLSPIMACPILPPAIARPYAMIGRNGAQSSAHGQPFSITGLQFWQRALAPSEMALLASTIPATIGPVQFTLINMPKFGQPDTTFSTIYMQTSVCAAVNVAFAVSPFGYTNVPSVGWASGNCGLKPFVLTTSNGNPTPTSWTLSFTITGAAASSFQMPAVVLPVLTYDSVWASAGVTVDASQPSLHAQRTQTNTGGYVVSFLTPPSYLDLNSVSDTFSTGGSTMDMMPWIGGEFGSFSLSSWIRWPSTNVGSDGKLFSCSQGGSSAHEMYLAQAGNKMQLQFGFRYNDLIVCRASFGTPTPSATSITPDQFNAIAFVLDPAGMVSFWLNGVSIYSALCALVHLPRFLARPSCYAGISSYDQRNQSTVSLSRYAYYPRNLAAQEIYSIATNPPPALYSADVIVLGVPMYAVDNYLVSPVRVTVGVCTGETVTLTATLISVGVAGNAAANSSMLAGIVTFGPGNCAPKDFAFTIQADLLVPRWVLQWSITGVTAAVYALPASFLIQRATYPVSMASTTFNLNTTLPSLHAGWRSGAVAGSGYVTFDATKGQYLDLSNPPDVSNSQTFPEYFGGAGHAFALDLWLQRPSVLGSTNAVFLQCTLGLGSNCDSFRISQDGSTSNFIYSLILGGDLPGYTSASIAAAPSEGWTHLLFRQDAFGVVSLYVNGALSAALGQVNAPNRAQRASCTVSRQSWEPAPAGSAWTGHLAALRFWDRDVTAPEAMILALNIPSSLMPSSMIVTNLPSLVMLNDVLDVLLQPSTYWQTSLTVTLAVSPVAATINTTTMSFSTFADFSLPKAFRFTAPPFGTNVTFTFTFSDAVHYPTQIVRTLVFLGTFTPVATLALVPGGFVDVAHTLLPTPRTSVSLSFTTPHSTGYTLSPSTVSWTAATYGFGPNEVFRITAPFNAEVGNNVTLCSTVSGTDEPFYLVPACFAIFIIEPSSIIVVSQPAAQVAALLTTTIGFKLSSPPASAAGTPPVVELWFSLGHPTGGVGGGLVGYPLSFTTANWSTTQFVTLQAPALAQNLTITMVVAGVSAQQYMSPPPQSLWTVAITARLAFVVPTVMLIGQRTVSIGVSVVGFPSSTPNLCARFELRNLPVVTPAVQVMASATSEMCFAVDSGTRFFNFTAPTQATSALQLVVSPVSGSDVANFITQTLPITVQGLLLVTTPGSHVIDASTTVQIYVSTEGFLSSSGSLTIVLSSNASGTFSQSTLTFTNPTLPQMVEYTDNTGVDGIAVISATVTGGTAASLCINGTLELQVEGPRSPVLLVSPTLRGVVGSAVALSFVLSAIPSDSVTLNLAMSNNLPGDALSHTLLSFSSSDWNVTHTSTVTSVGPMHNISVTVSISGPSSSQYKLGFANPLIVTATGTLSLSPVPLYILAARPNTLTLQSLYYPTGNPDVCIGSTAVSSPPTVCFGGGGDQQMAITAAPNAGPMSLTFSAVSGLAASDFVPYTVVLAVKGYVTLVPDPAMGSVLNANGWWNATTQSDFVIRVSTVGLPAGTLQLQLSSNSTGLFSTNLFSLTVFANGTSETMFVYRDDSPLSSVVRIESKVVGGSLSTDSHIISEMFIVVSGMRGRLDLTTSADVQASKVLPGVTQLMTLAPSAGPLPATTLDVTMQVTGGCTAAITPAGGTVQFTAANWHIPRNLTIVSSSIGQTCNIGLVVAAPNDAQFDLPSASFMVLNSFAATGFPLRIRAARTFTIVLAPFYGVAAVDMCVSLTSQSDRLSFSNPTPCFNGGAQTIVITAPALYGPANMIVTPLSGTVMTQFMPLQLSLDVMGYVVAAPSAGSGAVDLGGGRWQIASQQVTPLTVQTVGLSSGTLQLQLVSSSPSVLTPTNLTLTAGTPTEVQYHDGSLTSRNITLSLTVTGGAVSQYAYIVNTIVLTVLGQQGRVHIMPSGLIATGSILQGAPAQRMVIVPSAAALSGSLSIQVSLTCPGGTGDSISPSLLSFSQSAWFVPQNVSLIVPSGDSVSCVFRAWAPTDSSFNESTVSFIVNPGASSSSTAGPGLPVVVDPTVAFLHPPSQVSVGDAFVLTSRLVSVDPLTVASSLVYRWRCLSHPSLDLTDVLSTIVAPANASSVSLRPDAITAPGDYAVELIVTDPDPQHRTAAGLPPAARLIAIVSVVPTVTLSVSVPAAEGQPAIDPCAQSPCANHGECVATASTTDASSFALSCRCPSSPVAFFGYICSFAIVLCPNCVSSYTGGQIVTFYGVGFHNIRSLAVNGRSVAFQSPVLRNASYSNDVRRALDRAREFNPALTELHELAMITPALVQRRNATTGEPISRRLMATASNDLFLDPSLDSNSSTALLTNPISAYQPFSLTAVLPGSSSPVQINFTSLLFYSSSSCLDAGVWRDDGAGGCLGCPAGGHCPGGGRVWPLPGFWSYSEYLPPQRCAIAEACPGVDVTVVRADQSDSSFTQACSPGYSGPQCASCADGFFQLNDRCFYCGSSTDQSRDIALTVFVASGAMIALSMAVAFLNANRLARSVQGFVLLQGIALVGVDGVKHIPWQTQKLSSAFTALNLINFDIEVLRPGCGGIPTFDYVRKVQATLLFMFMSGCLFALACGLRLCLRVRAHSARQRVLSREEVAILEQAAASGFLIDDDEPANAAGDDGKKPQLSAARRQASRRDVLQRAITQRAASTLNLHAHLTLMQRFRLFQRGADWQDAKQRLQHAMLILASIFYLRLAVLQFKAFVCVDSFDPTSPESDAEATQSLYLLEDMQTLCYRGAHLGVVVAVVCIFVLYSLGFPFFCFVLLMRAFATPDTPGLLGYLRARFSLLQGKKKKRLEVRGVGATAGAKGHRKQVASFAPSDMRKQGWVAEGLHDTAQPAQSPVTIARSKYAASPSAAASPPRLLSDIALAGPASPSAVAQPAGGHAYLHSVEEDEDERWTRQAEQQAAAAEALDAVNTEKAGGDGSTSADCVAAGLEPTDAIVQRDRENRYGYLFISYRRSQFLFCLQSFLTQLLVALVSVLVPSSESTLKLFLFGVLWSVNTMVVAIALPFDSWMANVRKVLVGLASLAHSIVLLSVQSGGSNSNYFIWSLAMFAAIALLLLFRRSLSPRWLRCKRRMEACKRHKKPLAITVHVTGQSDVELIRTQARIPMEADAQEDASGFAPTLDADAPAALPASSSSSASSPPPFDSVLTGQESVPVAAVADVAVPRLLSHSRSRSLALSSPRSDAAAAGFVASSSPASSPGPALSPATRSARILLPQSYRVQLQMRPVMLHPSPTRALPALKRAPLDAALDRPSLSAGDNPRSPVRQALSTEARAAAAAPLDFHMSPLLALASLAALSTPLPLPTQSSSPACASPGPCVDAQLSQPPVASTACPTAPGPLAASAESPPSDPPSSVLEAAVSPPSSGVPRLASASSVAPPVTTLPRYIPAAAAARSAVATVPVPLLIAPNTSSSPSAASLAGAAVPLPAVRVHAVPRPRPPLSLPPRFGGRAPQPASYPAASDSDGCVAPPSNAEAM